MDSSVAQGRSVNQRNRLDDGERKRRLEEIRATYRLYKEEGRSERWDHLQLRPGMAFAARERNEWLVNQLSGHVGTVVDLGCGDANAAIALDEAGLRPERYIGIDLIEERLEMAQARVPWGEFRIASADDTGLETESADSVMAVTLLSSVPDSGMRMAVGEEISRILRPGGRVLVYDMRYPSPGNRAIAPVPESSLRMMFPGWSMSTRTLTLLPPLARHAVWTIRQYRVLAAIPALRSHLGATLVKPG